MTTVAKIIIGLGTVAVGGTGTYMTYNYLSEKGNSSNQEKKGSVGTDNKQKCVEAEKDCSQDTEEEVQACNPPQVDGQPCPPNNNLER